jgi:predicted Zn-dependent peptidase
MYKFTHILLLISASLIFSFCKTQKATTMDKVSEKMTDFRANPPEPSDPKPINLGDYKQFTLDNGLTVIVVQNNKLPTRSYQLFVDVPPFNEGEIVGAADIMGSMLSEGTVSRSKIKLDEDIDFIGARFNTSEQGMFGSCLSRHSETLLTIMKEVLTEPSFPQESFDKLINQNISGLASSKADANSLASRVGNVVNFGKDSPYGEVVTEESLRRIRLDDTKRIFEKNFRPEISYLIIVGDISNEEALEQANTYFGDWKRGADQLEKVQPIGVFPDNRKVIFVDKPGAPQSLVYVTYPVEFTIQSEDYVKARLMNSIFGGYFGSRLNQKLREEKAYTYGARSILSKDEYMGYLRAGANVGNAVTDSAILDILTVMESLKGDFVTDQELQVAKNVAIGNFAIGLENPRTLANLALDIARYNLPADFYNNYASSINAVTKDDILVMARKYLHPEKAYVLVVGNKDEVAGRVKVFGTDGAIDYYDADGNLLETPSEDSSNFDPLEVLGDYLNAVGGVEKIKSISSYYKAGSASIMGQEIGIETYSVYPDRYKSSMKMSGMVMQSQIVNGESGIMMAQGRKSDLPADQLNTAREQMYLIPQVRYRSPQYKLTALGIESINGELAYKIKVETPFSSKTEFYSQSSGLLLQDIVSQEQMGQTMVITTIYSNYEENEGLLLPSITTIEGAAPVPLRIETKILEMNKEIEESTFNW